MSGIRFECPKSIRNYKKKKCLEHQTLGWQIIRHGEQATSVLYCKLSDFTHMEERKGRKIWVMTLTPSSFLSANCRWHMLLHCKHSWVRYTYFSTSRTFWAQWTKNRYIGKGQLILKYLLGVFNSSEKRTKTLEVP